MTRPKRILFLGGSITCGAHATDYEHSWARLTYKRIAPALYGENVEMLNASISGTNSRVAVFRLRDHVLKYKPDLVFVEFAVNDNVYVKSEPELVISCMDHIVRALAEANPNVAITFVYTTSRGENAAATHSVVARHYGIPEIDLQTPMQAEIDAGRHTWDDFLADVAHPTDAGHAFYADIVTQTILADPKRHLAPVKLRESIAKYPFSAPHIVPAALAKSNGFVEGPVDDLSKFKRMPELFVTRAAVSHRTGDTLTFDFEGQHFGLYYRIGNHGGRFTVTINGIEAGGDDTYYHHASDIPGEFISRYRVFGLAPGNHTAVVTVAPPNPASGGSEVCIAGAFVG